MRITRTEKEKAAMINCPEAYALWDLLSAKYQLQQNLLVWANFAHDADLQIAIEQLNKILERRIKDLEKNCRSFPLTGLLRGSKLSIQQQIQRYLLTRSLPEICWYGCKRELN